MFKIILLVFLCFVIVVDILFVSRAASNLKRLLIATMIAVTVLTLFADHFAPVAHWLGVGRFVDILIYLSVVILVRELFLGRARYNHLERQITLLTRKVAISNASSLKEWTKL